MEDEKFVPTVRASFVRHVAGGLKIVVRLPMRRGSEESNVGMVDVDAIDVGGFST